MDRVVPAGSRLTSTLGAAGSPSRSRSVGKSDVVKACDNRNGGLIAFDDDVPVRGLFQKIPYPPLMDGESSDKTQGIKT